MHDVLDVAPCGVLLFGDDGKIRVANATLSSLLGYEAHELDGKPIETILSLASRIFYNTHFFPLIKMHSRADEIFLTLVSRENKSIPVLSNAVRRITKAGCENIVVFMPVFERKRFEEEILEARRVAQDALAENKELQRLTERLESHSRALEIQNQKIHSINENLMQFNKIISHDLQEPIRKIRLFADVLLRSTEGPLSGHKKVAVEKIERSAERLNELTIGLQEYVRVDDEVQQQVINLNDCLSAGASRAKDLRNFRDLNLSFQALPAIEGYRKQLELLFYHLIDNAIQFRNISRPLEISVDHTLLEENVYRSIPDKYKFVEHVRIVFSDNGTGFNNEFRDQVFQLGSRLHLDGNGIGLGLAVMKKIVTNHGGTISIASSEGKGTDVTLLLPVRQLNV